MSKFSIDYDETCDAEFDPGNTGHAAYRSGVKLWDAPPEGISYEGAIEMMHQRTLALAKMLETIINVLPEMPVVNIPKGQRPGSDGFKP